MAENAGRCDAITFADLPFKLTKVTTAPGGGRSGCSRRGCRNSSARLRYGLDFDGVKAPCKPLHDRTDQACKAKTVCSAPRSSSQRFASASDSSIARSSPNTSSAREPSGGPQTPSRNDIATPVSNTAASSDISNTKNLIGIPPRVQATT